MVPNEWLPNVPMDRIIAHWSAGSYTASVTDKRAYHFVIEGDGGIVRGVDVSKNSVRLKDGYAPHTGNLNTGSIGVAVACMAGAVEVPFNAGRFPMKPEQFDKLCEFMAFLAKRYGIVISRRTTLSHAEVQPTLGVTQNRKWDFSRLPFDAPVGALAIGDFMRSKMTRNSDIVGEPMVEPIPAAGQGRVLAASLNVRDAPTINGAIKTTVSMGQILDILGQNDVWLSIKEPSGWVHKNYVEMVDGPKPLEPTTASPIRQKVSEIRQLLDEIEKGL